MACGVVPGRVAAIASKVLREAGADEVLIDDAELAPKVRQAHPRGIDRVLEDTARPSSSRAVFGGHEASLQRQRRPQR
jgi:hypothetical protein